MPLEFGQIVGPVGAAQLAGVNQAHVQVADLCPVQRSVEQGVLPMEYGPLQGPSSLASISCEAVNK